MTKDLGFGNVASKLADAAALKPTPINEPDPLPSAVRRMTNQVGIIPQEAPKIVRKRVPKGIGNPLNMRIDLALFNRFVNLSITKRLTYAETLEYLLDRAGVSADGQSAS
jgi:hypothetical protein